MGGVEAAEQKQFFVYLHKKPDGSVFYVGKGLLCRAMEFSPSRRTRWHNNIVRKHGVENIKVSLIECTDEEEAFSVEKNCIALFRSAGADLVNLTDGGEGVSGRKPTEAQSAGLAKGRMPGKRGVKGPRPQLAAWIRSEAGAEHVKRLGASNKGRVHAKRYTVTCADCGKEFETASHRAKCCSETCQQRHRRARGGK